MLDSRCALIRDGVPLLRVRLTPAQATARRIALTSLTSRAKALAQQIDVLPVFQDWTAFLGLGPYGECLWVDEEDHPGRVEPATDLLHLAILVCRCSQVAGLEDLVPARPPGRPPCPHCGGKGMLSLANGRVEAGCSCGGLGWLPISIEELGLEHGQSAG